MRVATPAGTEKTTRGDKLCKKNKQSKRRERNSMTKTETTTNNCTSDDGSRTRNENDGSKQTADVDATISMTTTEAQLKKRTQKRIDFRVSFICSNDNDCWALGACYEPMMNVWNRLRLLWFEIQ